MMKKSGSLILRAAPIGLLAALTPGKLELLLQHPFTGVLIETFPFPQAS